MFWNFFRNQKPAKEDLPNIEQITIDSANKDHDLFKFKLSSYSEATYVARVLLKRKKLMINLNDLEQKERRRILDFLSGVIFFQGGKVKKLQTNIYYFCLPINN